MKLSNGNLNILRIANPLFPFLSQVKLNKPNIDFIKETTMRPAKTANPIAITSFIICNLIERYKNKNR